MIIIKSRWREPDRRADENMRFAPEFLQVVVEV